MHSEVLAGKKEVIVLNKTDLDPDGEIVKDISERLAEANGDGGPAVMSISAVSGDGLAKLNEALWSIVKEPVQ